jgi:hypothetical protein
MMPAPLFKKLGITEDELRHSLIFLYNNKKLSQAKIASELGVDTTCVENWFKRFKIGTRSTTDALRVAHEKHVKISKTEMDKINGLLLSDLHIEAPHYQARFSFGLKHKEFAEHIINNLKLLSWSTPKYNSKTLGWHSKSKSFMEILDLREKWYKNNIKRIPKDIVITSETLYWWYMGDGRLMNYGIELCSESFEKSENEFLIEHLGVLELPARLTPQNRIRICGGDGVKLFSEIVGHPRIRCYDYKWNFRMKRKNGEWV